MPLLDTGRDHVATTLVGEAVTAFDAANAHIGVGDGTATFDSTHTDLQGASTHYGPMDSGYPSRTVNELTFRTTVAEVDGNFAWEEWGIFNGVSGSTMLNRVVESLGTKPSTQSWQFTTVITIQNP